MDNTVMFFNGFVSVRDREALPLLENNKLEEGRDKGVFFITPCRGLRVQ